MAIAGNKHRCEQYTWSRMEALQLEDFRPGTHKVLIIGDSQAADLVNIVFESQPSDKLSISTYTIPWSCPNLYLPYSVIEEIMPRDRAKCKAHAGYRSDILNLRLRDADEVWLASQWQYWNLKHLVVSLANLRSRYGDKFIIVGQKSSKYRVNRPMLAHLANMSLAQRKVTTVASDNDARKNNRYLRDHFGLLILDLQDALCYNDEHCRVFDDAGNVILYDGTHVTPAGAHFAGLFLARHPRLQHIFKTSTTFRVESASLTGSYRD
jgi:hypothetical protein